MGNFILAVLIPLPCDDPLAYAGQAIEPFAGEGNKTDGWEFLDLQGSQHVGATPTAYIAPDGSWHERAGDPYPEEAEQGRRLHAVAADHLARHGTSELGLLRQRLDEVPEPVTDWHRAWQAVTREAQCLVAFVWCHC